MTNQPIPEHFVRGMRGIFSAKFHTRSSAKIEAMSNDKWLHLRFLSHRDKERFLADGYVAPMSTDGLALAIQVAREFNVPIIARGGGSGVCGAVVPTNGGLVIDLKHLCNIVEINKKEGYALVEAGKYWARLDEELGQIGFRSGHTPASRDKATIGGAIALRGYGKDSSSHGSAVDQVLALGFVDSEGEFRYVHRDKINEFAGMAGTTGIINLVKLKIFPISQFMGFKAFLLPRMNHAPQALSILNEIISPLLKDGNGFNVRLYCPIDALFNGPGTPHGGDHRQKMQKLLLSHPSTSNFLGVLGARLGYLRPLLTINAQAFNLVDWKVISELFCDIELRLRDAGCQYLGPEKAWLDHENRFRLDFDKASRIVENWWDAGFFIETLDVDVPVDKSFAIFNAVKDSVQNMAIVMAHISHLQAGRCCIYFTFVGRRNYYGDACLNSKKSALKAGGRLAHHHGFGLDKKGFEKGTHEIGWYDKAKQLANPTFNPGKF